MSSETWPWKVPECKSSVYTKRLEGIKPTDTLLQIIEDTYNSASRKNDKKNNDDEYYSLSSMDAMELIRDFIGQTKKDAIPLGVIRALASILDDLTPLNGAIAESSLVYTPPRPRKSEDAADRKWQKRMDLLRLQSEEYRYTKLTNNLPKAVENDVTVKSMTYAASVGLNMIVAPISFGVFMYFFAGHIFSWGINPEEESQTNHRTSDIRRVIAGVVSGVIMLFIEMILFVIRTHTMEKSMRRKPKKTSPFGYTKPKA